MSSFHCGSSYVDSRSGSRRGIRMRFFVIWRGRFFIWWRGSRRWGRFGDWFGSIVWKRNNASRKIFHWRTTRTKGRWYWNIIDLSFNYIKISHLGRIKSIKFKKTNELISRRELLLPLFQRGRYYDEIPPHRFYNRCWNSHIILRYLSLRQSLINLVITNNSHLSYINASTFSSFFRYSWAAFELISSPHTKVTRLKRRARSNGVRSWVEYGICSVIDWISPYYRTLSNSSLWKFTPSRWLPAA